MTAATLPAGEKRRSAVSGAMLSSSVVSRAIADSFVKLNPMRLTRNPVILATELVAALATASTLAAFASGQSPWWAFQVALWLWFTVVFANFAEAMAEARGKADMLIAQHRRSRAAHRAADAEQNPTGENRTFDRMKSTVAREEAIGKAKAELLGEDVEARLHELERDEKIDTLLQELKQRKQLSA